MEIEVEAPENPIDHIVLFSGGMDSLITLRYVESTMRDLIGSVTKVYCRLGHRYEAEELRAVEKIAGGKVNIDETLRGLGVIEECDAHIPNRNAHLVLAALRFVPVYAKEVRIWLTVQKDELSLTDRSENFFKSISRLCSILSKRRVVVKTPWIDVDKTDMVRWYLERGYSENELRDTWACYRPSPEGVMCGNCGACIRRYIAMSLNGIHERYFHDPKSTSLAQYYLEKAKSGHYGEQRNERILEALDEKQSIESIES